MRGKNTTPGIINYQNITKTRTSATKQPTKTAHQSPATLCAGPARSWGSTWQKGENRFQQVVHESQHTQAAYALTPTKYINVKKKKI